MLSKFNQYSLFLIICIFLNSDSLFAQQNDTDFKMQFQEKELTLAQILSKYLQFESISGSEKEAGEFLKNICVDNDLHITQMGDKDGNYNFAASIKPLAENLPNIIFLNHIDVVPPGDSVKWKKPPFSGKIIGGEVWGRGAFDNKGAAIMQLGSVVEAKRFFENREIPYNITFLAVSCEETQCEGGVKYVVENHFEELNPVLVIGEGPPELTGIIKSDPNAGVYGISVAHKRAFWLKLELEVETSGHGSVTPLQYANKEMVVALNNLMKKKQKAVFTELNVNLLKQLGDLEKGVPSFVMRHPRFFKPLIVPKLRKIPEMFSLFSNTITITNISSNNEVVNQIPNKISALIDCRLLPFELSSVFLDNVKKRLKNDQIKITILKEMPPMMRLKENQMFYKNLEEVIKSYYPESHVLKVLVPNFNDVGIFRSKGVPGLSSIPVEIDKEIIECLHNYNERLPLTALKQGKEVYFEFIKKSLE